MRLPYRFLAIGAVLIALLGVLACGADDEQARQQPAAPAPAAPAATAAPVVISVPAPAPDPLAPAPAAAAQPAAPGPAPFTAVQLPKAAPIARQLAPTPAPATTEGPKFGGTLIYFPHATVGSLDPVRNTAAVVREVMNNIYDWPVGYDADLQLGLQMLESWTVNPDASEFTLTLRDGLLFHDGSPVEAADIASSLKRWPAFVGLPSQIWEIAMPTPVGVDAKTVKITMGDPFGLFMNYWAQLPTSIMRQETADKLAFEDTNTDYIGSGPYKFISWTPGHKVVMDRFAEYVSRPETKDGVAGGRPAYVDRIEFIEVPDSASRFAGLQTGQADIVSGVPADFFQAMLDDDNIKASVLKPYFKAELATNKTLSPLNNPKSRLAMQAAHDPVKAMTLMYGDPDLYTVCPALWFCGSQWDSDEGADLYYEVDIDKARRLWQEAIDETGHTGKIVFLANTDIAFLYNVALYTREILEDLGADLSFEVSDWAALISRKITNLDKPPDQGGWHFYETGDEGAIDPLGDSAVGTSWNGGWDNPRGQQLRKDYLKAKTYPEAKAIIDELQKLYYEEDPSLLNHGYAPDIIALQADVFGYTAFNLACGYCDNVWLDR